MNALVIPILLICALLVLIGFVVWMAFFSSRGKHVITEQHGREHRHERRPM